MPDSTRRISLPDAVLEVEVRGSGEPVVLIQTALTADEQAPLADRLLLDGDYQVILYHRRGYAGSSAVEGPGSVERDAVDCRLLLAELGVDAAHVVGLSYSGAVALQLAVTAPDCVRSLCLVEPPPVHLTEFRTAILELIGQSRTQGTAAALDQFMTALTGPDWRGDLERHVPGGVAQMDRDADTFFATDLPALLSWRFAKEDAEPIDRPVLYVGGTDSGPWFAASRERILEWLPQTEDVMIDGADHSLAVTHAPQLAAALTTFLRRHPAAGDPAAQ